MIKTIFFDVGSCYLQGSFRKFVKKSCNMLGIENLATPEHHNVTFDENLNRGKISHEDCFRNYFKVPISDEQMKIIKQYWMTTWVATEEMLELVENLKKNNYKLAILSNSDSLNSPNYEKKGWYDNFEELILSHELGFIKPEKKIYEIALEKTNSNPEECLFIDDQERVLIPAREMGMKTIRFNSIVQLKEELREIEIKF